MESAVNLFIPDAGFRRRYVVRLLVPHLVVVLYLVVILHIYKRSLYMHGDPERSWEAWFFHGFWKVGTV